ncbi:MAG: ATP-binding protein [Bacteroidales bacterium]
MDKVRRTFSKRLSRNILLLAIPLFVLALGVFYQNAERLLHKEAVERSRTILSTTTQLVDNYLTTIETAAKSNLWMLEEHFNPDSLAVISHRIVSLNNDVISCSVAAEPNTFPEYGENFSVYTVSEDDTIYTELEPEFEYFQKNWYRITKQTGKASWINPFSDFNAGIINHHDAVGSYCLPIRPHGNKIEGVVSVDFSFERLRETILATHHPYPNSYYMVLGPAGGYLIHPDNNLLFKKSIFMATDSVQHPDIFALGHEMIAHNNGTMHVTLDNELCHVAYMPLADTGWSIALVCQEDDVLEDYNQLTIIVIVFVIIGILLIAWMTRKVVQRNIGPLNELMEAANKISEGNYDTVIPSSNQKDVVGKLQNAFRKMQLSILSHHKEIESTEAEIEKDCVELEQTLPLALEANKRRRLFIQKVSRQFTTPLNTIEGLTRVLVDNIAAKNKGKATKRQQNKDLNDVKATLLYDTHRVLRYTQMIFDTSDTDAANSSRYKKTDNMLCNEVARESINFTQQYYGSDIQFETEVPDNFSIKSNYHFVMLSIRELLYNAAYYSDGQHISLRIKQTESTVRFIIEDVGPGLQNMAEELLYVPFTKVDDLSEGLGLGLPLCKKHITNLGGDFILDEEYQQGCRFIVELPKE